MPTNKLPKPRSVKIGKTIDVIAKQTDALAQRTGEGAPRITLAPNFRGTFIDYRGKRHQISDDAYVMSLYVTALNGLFAKLRWPWRLSYENSVLTLAPVDVPAPRKRAH